MVDGNRREEEDAAACHPYHFLVSGPRNLPSPNWKDLLRSSWKDPDYRRTAMACFVQAAYLLELDRQEKRAEAAGLAPNWWKPFRYKLRRTLVDARDGSIYGAVLEWDRVAAMADLVLARPRGAPKLVLALRGTLLRRPTARRDLLDDLRFVARESLKGSVRFAGALEVVRAAAERFGSAGVCVCGHSLGAAFALQVGKALAKEGLLVECHLFNPPSVSLAASLRIAGEKASYALRRTPHPSKKLASGSTANTWRARWLPNLYVNNNDYICCYYGVSSEQDTGGEGDRVAKLFVVAKGPTSFLEAHGLQQWWSDDLELELAANDSKLINRQLRSLYAFSDRS
ncbi:GDSL esterase/lipase At4g10955-like [Zingiber officinale]|uniref:GDSL esterase/lipase n=1 Tax=Zingiber officinale TaxID=94328 RepID=A0A8J5HA01_ZINOF|nr:GDSL esterase/lipase At4g10955-like [Zingiber officinale]KAG6524095.1 hypothetical protein ZIOFF_013985 [Zingiber officinale]